MISGANPPLEIAPHRLLHLVGSIPLPDARETFSRVSAAIGPYLSRITDGETGDRSDWIRWQLRALGDNPAFEGEATSKTAFQSLRLREMRRPELAKLGYADAALASHAGLRDAIATGHADGHHKLQISLPTPVAITGAYTAKGSQALVLEAMERAMDREVKTILDALPHDQIAIQWDVAIEIAVLEAVLPWYGADTLAPDELNVEFAGRIARLVEAVPPDVEVGIHFCYGDSNGRNFKRPTDLGLIGTLLQSILTRVRRPVDFVHVPAPPEADHCDYFSPLDWMSGGGSPFLYLGLIHLADGREGAHRRMAAAREVLAIPFGVAAACGFGRRDSETLDALLTLHRQLAEDIAQESPGEQL